MSGWIGVDLDGTLAHYEGWRGPTWIGAPVPAMAARVLRWLEEGREVRIVTARVAATGLPNGNGGVDDGTFSQQQRAMIEEWCELHLGRKLPVTASKDFGMLELWDDRCVQVEKNTGQPIGYSTRNFG